MPSHYNSRRQTDITNTIIDRALLEVSVERRQQVVRLTESDSVVRLAERLRKRATMLAKRRRSETKAILEGRDELILHLYASTVPKGWSCGWSDGSSVRADSHFRAGIGGILMDSGGNIIERISRSIGAQDAFDAELVAVVAVMQSAIALKQLRLMVYIDNEGIVQLWHEKRDDKRLDDINRLRKRFERFALEKIRRLHNQPANALAKQAVKLDRP